MYRVLEMGGNWSGPMVGQYLQALGCDVIRLESREHLDAVRQLPAPRDCGRKIEGATPADNPYFAQLNAGKRSIELDLGTEDGLRRARDLAASCDVVVENLSPGAIDRLGLSYATLATVNPGICMLSMPTLHPGDPRDGLRGYAPVFTGLGGLEIEVGYPGEVTGMLMTGWGDPVGGMTGLLGLLAALHRRESTGTGSYVIVSQLKAVTWQLVGPFTTWLGHAQNDAPDVRVVATQDPRMWIVVQLRAGGVDVAGAQGLEQWAAERAPSLVIAELRRGGHDAAIVERIEDATASERCARRGVASEVSGEGVTAGWPRYHIPWVRDGLVPQVSGDAPSLGEHTDEVTAEPAGSSAPSA